MTLVRTTAFAVAAALLAACRPEPITLERRCVPTPPQEVPADWSGLSESSILARFEAAIPSEVAWAVSPNVAASPVAIAATRTAEPAYVESGCMEGARIVLPVTFDVDIHDGAAAATFDGILYAWEHDDTFGVEAGGAATLSDDWLALADAETLGGSESTQIVLWDGQPTLLDVRSAGPSSVHTVWRARFWDPAVEE